MLGRYQLIAELARGGMAIVYLAVVQGPGGFNKLVVVKELKPELIDEPAFLTMFLDEARLAARLSHPNIVQTNEVGNDSNRTFMAMDYLDGRGLDRVRRRALSTGRELSLPIHLRVICDMLAGLHYAHTLTDFDGTHLSIVHRDVSPQNVFVTFDGQIKLLDFGIAKTTDSIYETRAGVLKGKVAYMAPEQARGQKVDARADVFSTGIMLWEALTGRRMYEGQNDQATLWALASGDLPRASSVKPWVPPLLDEICARAMAWDRDKRYPSAGDLLHDLERYLETTDSGVTPREVGLCVSDLFRDDRIRVNGVIESHIARIRADAPREALPVLDLAVRGLTPSSERDVSPAQRSVQSVVPRLTGIDDEVQPSDRALVGPPRTRARRGATLLAACGLAVVAAAIALWVGRTGDEVAVAQPWRSEPPSPAPLVITSTSEPSPAPPAPAPAPSPRERPELISVKVRISPENASIAIDGATVMGNPFSGKYVGDGAIHQVRVTAPGYIPKSVAVEFNANVALDLNLERIPPRTPEPRPPRPTPAPRSPEPRVTESPPPAPEPAVAKPRPVEPAAAKPRPIDADEAVDPGGGSQVKRPIEPNDPYGGEP